MNSDNEKNEVQKDVDELNNLLKIVTRGRVKDFLSKEVKRLTQTLSSPSSPSPPAPPSEEISNKPIDKSALNKKFYTDILTYAWDQSENFMKIYVTIEGVHEADKNNVTCDFHNRSFLLKAEDINKKNYKCHIAFLHEPIIIKDSYIKIKTNTVLVMLKKEQKGKTWPYLVLKEDKQKTPKFDKEKDPSESMMDLMKNLYEQGDDEMKRTIAKSFAESRAKNSGMGGPEEMDM